MIFGYPNINRSVQLSKYMDYAPTSVVSPNYGDQQGRLEADEHTVKWNRYGYVYRVFTMPHNVVSAVFTTFSNCSDPEELWICITCEDNIVYTYGTKSGDHHTTGLSVKPHTILSCTGKGLVITSLQQENQRIFFLQGPESLLHAIVPSSVDLPISKDDELKYFDERTALMWNPVKELVTVYEVRMIKHQSIPKPAASTNASTTQQAPNSHTIDELLLPNQLAANSVNLDMFAKAAVISPVQEWPQKSVGAVYSSIRKGEESESLLVTVHDYLQNQLYTLYENALLCTEGVTSTAQVAGIYTFPGLFVVINGEVYFKLLSLPHLTPLKVPLEDCFDSLMCPVQKISAEKNGNAVTIILENGSETCLLLASNLDKPMKTAFSILEKSVGFNETGVLALEYLANHVHLSNEWDAFMATIEGAMPDFEPALRDEIILKLHLLSEDLSLTLVDMNPIKSIRRLVEVYNADFKEFSIYMLLISTLEDQRTYSCIPEIVFNDKLTFPNIYTILKLFHALSQTPEMLKQFIETSKIEKIRWSPAVQMCVLEIMNYIAIEQKPALKYIDVDEMARSLFNKDLRFQEAVKLLRTDEPQQCLFGTLIDQSLLNESEFLKVKSEWSELLATRAYMSAFGRAALDIHTKSPFIWEQLSPSTVNCDGYCTETGTTLKSNLDDVSEAETKIPNGVFAQGVCLGLSIKPNTTGTDSLWVFTSSRIAKHSTGFFAGFVLGTGLSGHLSNIEDWQFYESLVKANTEGMLAALLGLSASKKGSRDSKLTKVLSVHVRALLPEDAQNTLLVNPIVEQSALIAIGILFLKHEDRYITGVFTRELKLHSIRKNEDTTQSDCRNMATGIALGLINMGKHNLESLLPLLNNVSDSPDLPLGVSNGATVALMLSYVGSNNKLVALELKPPTSALSAHYYTPHALYTRMLAYYLIMWDSVEVSTEWVVAQTPAYLRGNDENPVEHLWYDYALAGVLTAVAMQHISTNNAEVIDLLLGYIEDHFLAKLRDNVDMQATKPQDFESLTVATELADLVSALALAVSAVAAGYGNISVFRLLRELWQVQPQYFGREGISSEIKFNGALISQGIGWLFLRGGQWALKTDKESAAFLACFSFADILAGPNVNSTSWSHLKFFWSMVTEKRCIYALPDPREKIHIKIYEKGDQKEKVYAGEMPLLLPPLQKVTKIVVEDDRYMPLEISPKTSADLVNGINVIKKERPDEKLDSMLDSILKEKPKTNPVNKVKRLRSALSAIAKQPENEIDELGLRMLLVFYDRMPVNDFDRLLKRSDVENLKLQVWSLAAL